MVWWMLIRLVIPALSCMVTVSFTWMYMISNGPQVLKASLSLIVLSYLRACCPKGIIIYEGFSIASDNLPVCYKKKSRNMLQENTSINTLASSTIDMVDLITLFLFLDHCQQSVRLLVVFMVDIRSDIVQSMILHVALDFVFTGHQNI